MGLGWLTRLASACVVAAMAVVLPLGARATDSDAARIASMVNASRAADHLRTLQTDPGLDAVAQRQAERMADARDIFHSDHLKQDVTSTGLRWLVAGENVGVGGDVVRIEDAFMNSPEHRHNILDGRFSQIGIGVAWAGPDEVYVTQVFVQTLGPVATEI